MSVRIQAVLAVVVLLLGSLHLRGEEPGSKPVGRNVGDHGTGGDTILERVIKNPHFGEGLGLSDAQVSELRKSASELRKRQEALRAELETSALEQARLMARKNVDEEALMRAVEKSGRVKTELAKLRIRQLLHLRDTLTNEQMRRLRSWRNKRTGAKLRENAARRGWKRSGTNQEGPANSEAPGAD